MLLTPVELPGCNSSHSLRKEVQHSSPDMAKQNQKLGIAYQESLTDNPNLSSFYIACEIEQGAKTHIFLICFWWLLVMWLVVLLMGERRGRGHPLRGRRWSGPRRSTSTVRGIGKRATATNRSPSCWGSSTRTPSRGPAARCSTTWWHSASPAGGERRARLWKGFSNTLITDLFHQNCSASVRFARHPTLYTVISAKF